MLSAAADSVTDFVLCGIAALIALVLPAGNARQLLLELTDPALIAVAMQRYRSPSSTAVGSSPTRSSDSTEIRPTR